MAEIKIFSNQATHLRRQAAGKFAMRIESPEALSPEETRRVRHEPRKARQGGTSFRARMESIAEQDANGTVLIVEDKEMVREVGATMLMHLGFAVLEARDGAEAVEMFRRHRHEIRCVLCDLTMPRMDGWETLAALRKLSPNIPVILSSGYNEAQVMAGEHPERPDAFLGKPYELQMLGDAIRRAAQGSQRVQ